MEENSTYPNAEELATSLPFIEWVKRGMPEDSSSLPFKDLAPSLIEDAVELVKAFQFEDRGISLHSQRHIWRNIQEGIGTQPKVKVVRFAYGKWAAAASIFICIVAAWMIWSTPAQKTILVAKAEQEVVDLPDASSAIVNADSKITYIESDWQKERHIELQGEAFFQVEKGAPFRVQTPQGQVEVLGTSFNVHARDGLFEVECFTGRVRVTHEGQEVILTKGQGVSLSEGELQSQPFDLQSEKHWREGYYLYEEEPVLLAFEEISRQFNVNIDYGQVDTSIPYTGFFTKKDLREALMAVCWPMRLNFTIEDGQVTIFEESK